MAQAFQDLTVWQGAMELAQAVYGLTKTFPKDEIYGLTSQLRRASVSIASNIAVAVEELQIATSNSFSISHRVQRMKFTHSFYLLSE